MKIIPLAAVQDISRKKNVGFPNSIQVTWESGPPSGNVVVKKEFLTSFLSREDAYRLMLGLWARCSEVGKERAAAELGLQGTDTEGEGGEGGGGGGGTTGRGLSRRWSKWSRIHTAPAGNLEKDAATAAASAAAKNTTDAMHRTRTTVIREAEREDDEDDDATAATTNTTTRNQPSREEEERGLLDEQWMGRSISPPPAPAAAAAGATSSTTGGTGADINILSDNEDIDQMYARSSFLPGTTSIREFEDGPTSDDACVVAEFDAATAPAPRFPETMQRVLKCTLPTTPLGFYRAFLCPSSDFFVAFHESQGHHTIQLSPWQRHYKVGPVRDLRFVTPLRGWRIGPPQALCHQTQRFRVYANQCLVFETSQVMNDIPYGDHFRVDQRWDVTPGEEPGTCTLEVNIAVPFTKNTMWKRIIERSVTDSTLEAFQMFKELADRQLEGLSSTSEGMAAAAAAAAAAPASAPASATAATSTATDEVGSGMHVGMATPVAAGAAPGASTAPFHYHRRTPSRPASPEETLPSSNEEWEALLAQVEPQWRGGLRALRRMQLQTTTTTTGGGVGVGAGGGSSGPVSPSLAVSRHRRRVSRTSRSGSAGFELQTQGSGPMNIPMNVQTVPPPSSSPVPASPFLARVPEGRPSSAAATDGLHAAPTAPAVTQNKTKTNRLSYVIDRVSGFLSRRGPVLLLCLLLSVVVLLQCGLFVLQLRKTAPLFEPSGIAGTDGTTEAVGRQHMAREMASISANLEGVHRDVQAWAAQREATVKALEMLNERIKRVQSVLLQPPSPPSPLTD